MAIVRVLIGCEFSGVVRRAFRGIGADAYSCDLLPSEDDSEYHIQDDVLSHLGEGWDLGIFHPPCTYLANSGVCHLYKNGKGKRPDLARWMNMGSSVKFFKTLLEAPILGVAVENPIMHGYAKKHIGEQTQIIHPWQFGHGESKATCLWLRGLPKLVPTDIVEGREQRLFRLGPSPNRWKERSRTYSGIADAMAEQWSI